MLKNIHQLLQYIVRRVYESIYVFIARIFHIIGRGTIVTDTTKYKRFIVNISELKHKKRKEGISGFYRVKNEEDLLEASVESHIKYLDEIVIVYNDCSDKTSTIAKRLQQKYPNKVKVYEYLPEVYPVLSKKHMLEIGKSPHSIVNYYNFTLSKTTRKIVVKIDADHIVVDNIFEEAVDTIKHNMQNKYYFFHGVNIFECKNGGVCINAKNPFTYGLDCGFFKVKNNMYFVHRRKYESLKIPLNVYFNKKNLGVLFYHLKGFKKDRGISFLKNTVKDSHNEVARIKDVQMCPDLVSWEKFKDVKLDKIISPKSKLKKLIGKNHF